MVAESSDTHSMPVQVVSSRVCLTIEDVLCMERKEMKGAHEFCNVLRTNNFRIEAFGARFDPLDGNVVRGNFCTVPSYYGSC